MPSKPMKPCTSPMCAELTRDKYCSEHQDKVQENTRHYDKYIRNKSSRSFYNSKPWREMRGLIFRRDHGLCVQCRSNGIIKIGDVVDHIIPIRVDWSKRLEPTNLQTLCHACHNKKTKEDEKKNRK
ncbi:HNH endonuclease [Bacillus toyonensis]|uniref:Putative HNH nuclease YajD n=1 Tax=Bacillus toyonensis TaxID=155322 RepID=A0A2B5XMB4_9BACI|nr:HNH endonuclease [Bacillus toyonensis]PGA97525.1 HNH endonuclease [Bacillus toyonensis]PHD64220.1 HNH endonuclease [Bacillus toyonensis]